MQQANVPIRPQFPRSNVVLRRPGQKFRGLPVRGLLQIAAVVLAGRAQPAMRSRHQGSSGGCRCRKFSAVCRRRRTGDAGDSAAGSIRHCRPCLLRTMRSNYITTSLIRQSRQTIMLDQPVPFSHAHHVGGLASTAVTATPGYKVDDRRRSSDPHLHDVSAARARGLPDRSGPGERASASHRRRGACPGSHSCCADVCRLSARRLC